MAITGRKTYFKLNGTDVSRYFNGVSPSNNQEELDGTTFQPDVAKPKKDIIYGFEDTRYALAGVHTAASHAFFAALNGTTNVEYVYGPEGHVSGQTRIHGQCNVGKYSRPVSGVSGITTFSVEIAVTSETNDTFDGGSPM